MANNEISALNDVTKMLIDSQKGYEMAAEVADDNHHLSQSFKSRATQRGDLVNKFQQRVRDLGGEPQTEGGVLGSLHRSMTEFSSIFTSNEKAALNAIDDGEERLAEKVSNELENGTFSALSQDLMGEARQSARMGERFADTRDG